MIDPPKINEIAERISKGENGGLYQELNSLCQPYFRSLARRFGFSCISAHAIEQSVGPDAIHRAIVNEAGIALPFNTRLQNAFRNSCRQEVRFLRAKHIEKLWRIIQARPIQGDFGLSPLEHLSRKEFRGAFLVALAQHDRLSKRAVIRRMRGATYVEIGMCLTISPEKSKSIFWHDFTNIKNYFLSQYKSNDKFLGGET